MNDTATSITSSIERDITLAEAARQLGRSPESLRRVWGAIPTAYVDGGRHYVNPVGLRLWLYERSGHTAAEANDASAADAR